MLPSRTAQTKALHKVAMTAVDHHQVRNTVFRDSKAIKVYIGRTRSPKLCWTKVINFRLIKTNEERCSIIWNGDMTTTTYLKLRRNSRKRTCNKGGVEHKGTLKKKKEEKGDEVKGKGKSAKKNYYQEWGLRV